MLNLDDFERIGQMLGTWATAIVAALGIKRVEKIHETAQEIKDRLAKEKEKEKQGS